MFKPSYPVTDDDFFDREAQVARLLDHIERLKAGAPSWVALLGLRKVGKTSLLLEVARRAESEKLVFVILDTHEFGPVGMAVVRRYAVRVADAILAPRLGTSLEALLSRPEAYRRALVRSEAVLSLTPEVRQLLLELPDLGDSSEEQRQCLQLAEALADSLDLHVVVAWDEFQALARLRGTQGGGLVQMMRAIWQRHRRVEYIVSGSERTMLTEMLASHQSPFFQHFAIIELDPMSHEDGVRLLLDAAPPERPIPVAVAGRVVQLLGGHPFYLQLFGEELTALPPPYDDDAVKHAVQALLFSRAGRLALFFESEYRSIVGRSTYLAAVLSSLARGPKRLTELARAVGAAPGATKRYLERLGDAVTSTDGVHRVSDRVFALWLDWRAPGGTVVPMGVLGDEGEMRAARHLADLGFDLVYQSRASRGAFDLLAVRGPRQLGVQVKRSALPLHFAEAEWQRLHAEADRLGWRWVVVSVDPEGEDVRALDPARARGRGGRALHEDASIDNLLRWLDARP